MSNPDKNGVFHFEPHEDIFRILMEIASRPSKNTKRNILTYQANNQEMKDLLDATFNYKRRFYIKKWDKQPPYSGSVNLHDIFMALLRDLESQKYRGDQ